MGVEGRRGRMDLGRLEGDLGGGEDGLMDRQGEVVYRRESGGEGRGYQSTVVAEVAVGLVGEGDGEEDIEKRLVPWTEALGA